MQEVQGMCLDPCQGQKSLYNSLTVEGNLGGLEPKGTTKPHTIQQSSRGKFIGGWGAEVASQREWKEGGGEKGLLFLRGSSEYMHRGNLLYSLAAVVTG